MYHNINANATVTFSNNPKQKYLEYASQTKLKQNSYNAPEYKQPQKIQ